jgi:two-component system cell cycle response regulator CtrA
MRILVVDDEKFTSELLCLILKSEGFICDVVSLGCDSIEVAAMYEYDLIILDLVLPDMTGYDVLEKLRAQGMNSPVLILSGLTDPQNKVTGFVAGADDYLTKPFNRSELVARVQALIRRSRGYSSPIININNRLKIHVDKRIAEVDCQMLYLTGKEYAILEFFAMSRGKVLTKEMFLNHLYGGIDEPEAKIIDVFVCKLRKKLEAALGEDGSFIIETMWGRGYMMRSLANSIAPEHNIVVQ